MEELESSWRPKKEAPWSNLGGLSNEISSSLWKMARLDKKVRWAALKNRRLTQQRLREVKRQAAREAQQREETRERHARWAERAARGGGGGAANGSGAEAAEVAAAADAAADQSGQRPPAAAGAARMLSPKQRLGMFGDEDNGPESDDSAGLPSRSLAMTPTSASSPSARRSRLRPSPKAAAPRVPRDPAERAAVAAIWGDMLDSSDEDTAKAEAESSAAGEADSAVGHSRARSSSMTDSLAGSASLPGSFAVSTAGARAAPDPQVGAGARVAAHRRRRRLEARTQLDPTRELLTAEQAAALAAHQKSAQADTDIICDGCGGCKVPLPALPRGWKEYPPDEDYPTAPYFYRASDGAVSWDTPAGSDPVLLAMWTASKTTQRVCDCAVTAAAKATQRKGRWKRSLMRMGSGRLHKSGSRGSGTGSARPTDQSDSDGSFDDDF